MESAGESGPRPELRGVLEWQVDPTVEGSHNLKAVRVEDYVLALEAALRHLTGSDLLAYQLRATCPTAWRERTSVVDLIAPRYQPHPEDELSLELLEIVRRRTSSHLHVIPPQDEGA